MNKGYANGEPEKTTMMLSSTALTIVGLLLVMIPAGDQGNLIRTGWLRVLIALTGVSVCQVGMFLAVIAARAACNQLGVPA